MTDTEQGGAQAGGVEARIKTVTGIIRDHLDDLTADIHFDIGDKDQVAENAAHGVVAALATPAASPATEDVDLAANFFSMTPREVHAALASPSPAPPPVDAAGLVARLSAKAQALYQTRSADDHAGWEAGGALWEAASALAAAAEREAALEEKVRQSALDYLALDMQATEALEREKALVRRNAFLEQTKGCDMNDFVQMGMARDEAEARVTAAEAERDKLREAALQCLDDMGATGRSVCGLAKAELRWALGPMDGDEEAPVYSYDEALEVMIACDEQHGKPSGHREEQRARAAIRKETT